MRHLRKWNTANARSPQKISHTSERKICIVTMRHVLSDYWHRLLITTKMGFQFILQLSTVQYSKSFLPLYEQVFCITRTAHPWRRSRVKDIYMIRYEWNIIGHTWGMTFTWLWDIFANESKIGRQRNEDAFTTIFRKRPIGICRNGHSETTFEEAKRQSAPNGNDRSFHEDNKIHTDDKHNCFAHSDIIYDHWVVPYEISTNVLTDNGTQSINKFPSPYAPFKEFST